MRIQQFDYSVDILKALLWQYNEASAVELLLTLKQQWYTVNQTDFWHAWFADVFNLETANDFGLAVWSIILNIPLVIGPTPDAPDKPIWGFGEFYANFNNGNFSQAPHSSGLTTEEKRLILRLRYFQLTSRCAIPEINRFLKILFASFGSVYILDGLDMSIACVFTFNPGTRFLYLLEYYDVIPRGGGVKIHFVVSSRETWGFGPYFKNFERGNFGA